MHMSRRILQALAIAICLLSSCGGDGKEDIPDPKDEPKSKSDYPDPGVEKNPLVDYTKWSIHDGKFYIDGKWKFLKIAKPLTITSNPPEAQEIIDELDDMARYHYNTVEICCSWDWYDTDGDGHLDKSVEPLRKVVDAVYAKGMYPCINLGNYSVGGNGVPEGFWSSHGDEVYAVDRNGKLVTDTEYGFGSKVVSLFNEDYLKASRQYIKEIAEALDLNKVLYVETTVEPQYMGAVALDYSENARKAYNEWRTRNGITDPSSEMPETFPIPDSFVQNKTWNRFRAQYLAEWVNGDAAAWRSVAGKNAYVAVDYLETDGGEMYLRNGDSEEFLRNLTCANIIQVNWHWKFTTGSPNQAAYDHVYKIMRETGRDWAVSEHMTFNGSDYGFAESTLDRILENTLCNGTRFGWEFTNYRYSTKDNFTLYDSQGKPKRVMRAVDDYWGYWLHRIEEIENQKSGS